METFTEFLTGFNVRKHREISEVQNASKKAQKIIKITKIILKLFTNK